MPFDPALPAHGSPLQSAVIRSQLTSLKALIDAISAITQAQVDSVSTLNPGQPATANATITGDTLSFSFAIPQGAVGAAGPIGPEGPPFADAVVDGVSTLPAGDPATVSVSFNGSTVLFTFGIPQGIQGVQGEPGEVTNGQLSAAIATTALNPDSVTPMTVSFSDPPTSSELSQVQDKFNELLVALRRMV